MAQGATKRSHRKKHQAELDLLPVMNLFCVIIPFLLLSASFLEITTITMSQTQGINPNAVGAATNLAKSEEERIQAKVIMTDEELFVGTAFGLTSVGRAFQVQENGEAYVSFDFDELQERAAEMRDTLMAHYDIDFRKIVILTTQTMRYENVISAIDAVGRVGFTEPGLQVAPSASVEGEAERGRR
jgi:biopolymer transport protein ExbD